MKIKNLKNKVKLIFEYSKTRDRINFAHIDGEYLNVKVFLKDGQTFNTNEIEVITFNLKKDV